MRRCAVRPQQIALCYGSIIAYLCDFAFAFAKIRPPTTSRKP